ncbi:MAG: hypothetical protein AUI12_05380 [Acidobacteria bacterium 13_2_20CM_2_57_6]|nr:MAG: hypothetical protein AUI12_05380 [Acidobacteria bacterium 13_2_20CM_2_57_6]
MVERVSPSAVSILVGKGDGQVAGVASGVIIRSDGVILTANHVVKGMRELQVRLKSGEIYDQVELMASDERRDVAALRIAATGLPVLPVGNSTNAASGAAVFVVSNAVGLPWTASSGILSATRMAEDVPGAGSGYRILQFTAPLSPGSSGGVLVDAEARILGIVVGSLSVGQNINFAVPIESVAGLANASGGTRFDSGGRLQSLGAKTTAFPAAPANAPGMGQAVPPNPLCRARTSGKCTPFPCTPKQFICAASGCKTTFIKRRCSRTWDCASLITGKLPILQPRLTGRS